MAHSLEIRVPLVDAKLLTDTAGLASCDSAWNKQRLAMAPTNKLPSEIIQRAKTGFTTPMGEWIAHSLNRHSDKWAAKNVESGHWARQWSKNVSAAWNMELGM
jgi:asparagine synthase (glutamine-hydrolysing)